MRGIVAIAAALLSAQTAYAQDVGEIAVVEDSDGSIHGSIALPTSYLPRTACRFFETHGDNYDAIFVYTSAQLNTLTRVQQGFPVKGAAMGIGRESSFDLSRNFCTTRLRHAVKMGDVGAFDDDPDARYTGIPFFALSGVQLMAHEFGHQWLASVRIRQGPTTRCAIRGFEPSGEPMAGMCDGYEEGAFNQHWSYYLNSGSVMYGSTITDLGGGQFEVTLGDPKYSPLDQYLMGLRDPADVSPMFYVDTGDVAGAGSASLPIQPGRTDTINGTRVDFTVQDVIAAEGPRVPARDICHWKTAFVLIHPAGQPPTPQQIARVDRHRRRFEEFYAYATDRRGSMDTTLSGSGTGTAECPGSATPPSDAGVPAADANGPPAPDAEVAMDSNMMPPIDAGMIAADAEQPQPSNDAATNQPPRPIPDSGADDQVKVIGIDDCGCHETRSKGGGAWIFAVVLWLARKGRARR